MAYLTWTYVIGFVLISVVEPKFFPFRKFTDKQIHSKQFSVNSDPQSVEVFSSGIGNPKLEHFQEQFLEIVLNSNILYQIVHLKALFRYNLGPTHLAYVEPEPESQARSQDRNESENSEIADKNKRSWLKRKKSLDSRTSPTVAEYGLGYMVQNGANFLYRSPGIGFRVDGHYIGRHRLEKNIFPRMKRSHPVDRVKKGEQKNYDHFHGFRRERKVIHLPTLYIDPDNDGFQNVFYNEMIMAGLCLTSQPELNRHELVDEYEALLCNKKGYGRIIGSDSEPLPIRIKRDAKISSGGDQEDEVSQGNADESKWNMNKTSYDVLWKAEQNGTTTQHPLQDDSSEDKNVSVDYDYDSGESGNNASTTGWESDDHPEDPSHLDYMTWPKFLPDGIRDDDDLRKKFHSHKENFTLEYITGNLLVNQADVPFEKRLFALNDSTYLANYYEYLFKLAPYDLKPLLVKFFDERQATLMKFSDQNLTPHTLRQLFILFTIDVHHVNCFNRHIRFYGYMMKKPSSINGDEITNGARLARGIVMRSLELIRHVKPYNTYKDFLLRFLIGALKDRAALSKSLTTIIGENDYTEVYEVASYLEHTLKNGIHPDEINQDLFVQETRFYSHHFMNTLTL